MARITSFPFLHLLLFAVLLVIQVRAQDDAGFVSSLSSYLMRPRMEAHQSWMDGLPFVTTWVSPTFVPSPVPAGTIIDLSSYLGSLSSHASQAVGTNTQAFASLGLDQLGKFSEVDDEDSAAVGNNVKGLLAGLVLTLAGIVGGAWIAL
ncbi:hypothetical protein BT69DRAFT_1289402 [Atractiella rhizophila]|nr:hypothetical protein BT69DRAFT_1289402 [Atractiella rhizophila]